MNAAAVRFKKPAAGFPARALKSRDDEDMPVICPTCQIHLGAGRLNERAVYFVCRSFVHLEWTSRRIRWQIQAVGQTKRPTCRNCGTNLILAPAPDAKGRRSFSCERCEPADPLKSATACGWIMSELRPPT
jgi:hypothetical protein